MKQLYNFVRLACCLLLLSLAQVTYSQEGNPAVRGSVTGANGEPLTGVTVEAYNTKTKTASSTQTDQSGGFIFNDLRTGDIYRFTFTSVGYEKKVLEGFKYNGSATISIPVKLETNSSVLNDVVVVGYGTQKKVNLTGAVDQITSEELENRSILQSFTGFKRSSAQS